jgi:thiopeptide-type bacteriocin biosynthesis protein
LRLAERLFAVDSSIVAQMLQLSRSGQIRLDMTNLAVVSVDDLLDALGVNAEQRAGLYRESTVTKPDDGEVYRSRKNELRELLGRPSVVPDQHGPLAALLGARRAAMTPIAAELSSLEWENRLYRSRVQLLRAYVHMHANRLLGTDARSEQLTLRLLRRTRVGLLRHPFSTTPLLSD